MEKITFALVVASRKLCSYIKVNPLIVITNEPIKKAMNKPEATRKMIQSAIKLG